MIDANVIDDFVAMTMPKDEYAALFLAAARGEQNYLSRFVRPFWGRLTGKEWEDLRAEVFLRDGYACRYCGAVGAELHCDHIVPLCLGGSNDPDNLATACAACNLSKGGKPAGEWRP